MQVAVITESALSRKHGTGAQLLRILEGSPLDYFHLYLSRFYSGDSECARSYRLEDPRYTGRGRRYVGQLERLLGLNWWTGDRLSVDRFRRLRQTHRLECDVAYVCIAAESHAGKVNALLAELKVPYIVHVMDIYDDVGLDPRTMPEMGKLFRGAAVNIGLSQAICDEIAKFGEFDLRLIPIGQDVVDRLAQPPEPGVQVKILTVGKPYETGTRLLAEAWPALKRAIPSARIVYAGQHTHSLPEILTADLDNRGYISDKRVYEELLSECHVAYLSGPSELDRFGRFSIPSRTSDFLMAGLPIAAAVAEGSATQAFLAPLVPHAARVTLDAESIVQAVQSFTTDRDRWTAASQACRRFAIENVSMDQVREKVVAALESAAQSKR